MEIVESITGFSCPSCGEVCSDHTLVYRSESTFVEYPEYHYAWDEIHICRKCRLEYLIHNCT